MSQLELFLFGPPRLEFGGKPVDLKLRKAMAILVYLAITKRRSSRDELATMLWPESSQSSARASLRRTLYACNKNIGVEILLADTEAISLDPQVDLRIDVESFKQCMRECSPDGEQMRALNSHCLPVLEKAVALYTGDFLAGFSLPDSPVFDEWQFFESESLRSLLSTALQQLVFTYENQGKSPQAIEHARRWLSLDPLHEPAHQQLMKLYAQSGQQAAALRQYQECERILDQELGVPPQPETTACYQSIRLHRQTAPQPQVISQSEIKYVASGHVTIAYQVFGDGPLDIVWVSGFITHMEQLWKLQSLASFFTGLAEFSRVIMFDRRGVGLSDRVGYPPTLEDTMEDMQVVLQAVGSTHAVLFGYLEGGPNSMLFAATYPEHVSGLVLYGTAAKWARSENYPWALTHEQYDRWLHYISENWGEALNLDTYAPSYAHEPLYQEWFAKTLRLGSSPGGVKAVLEVMRDIDVRHVLPTIRIPTLILHRKGDRAIRVGAGRYLASQIPGAKYVELEGQDHWFFVGDSQSVLNEIRRFVQDLGSPPIPERMLATILIIEVMEDWMEPSAPSHTTDVYPHLQHEVAHFRGNEVSWSRNQYTVTFDGPSRAIRCAKAIQNIARLRGIKLRAGLHTGECEFTAGALAGTAVQITQGVMETATANEVLVSKTVKDLVVGSGLLFAEVDQIVVNGVSGTWKIFSVE